MDDISYKTYKNLIDEHILDFLPEIDHKSITLYDAMKYSLTAGGKRLRPILLLASCEFVGGDIGTAIPYACAMEYIHTYSLIHDDLPAMDDDELRRGLPTNHMVYGEAMAILAGDGLLTSAFEAMNKDMLLYLDDSVKLKRRIRAIYEISKGAGCRGMVAGQVADMEAENKQCSKEMLDYIHFNKTAALIAASVRAGAYLGGATEKQLRDLTGYAENLGLAFQIADDILDVCGDEQEMGKKAGNDEKKHKATYPCLYSLEECKAYLKDLTETAMSFLECYYDEAEFFNTFAEEMVARGK
ncbi:polyprenyl synthetase family protein [Aminipila luticellarii]|uniref:Farnesyl diphosphate synthase n=1 Tax=Aminipila luticellarii TaxID=2507160 RepID=A0A410PVF4_9FIRM|nr:farnesyl diphosphate synthase [Aminipila luticellarii]QAT42846.1 polyprenyl synthetase family protein [Aminipila luticellarii]